MKRTLIFSLCFLAITQMLLQAQFLPQRNSASTTDNAVSRSDYKPQTLNLSPAKWIWYPGKRVLPNTFILFRKVLNLKSKPRKATGWIHGESRYLLELNGKRVQWGPAPNDPRWPEIDPLDLTAQLTAGENVIGTTVLYYGHGDSTWPMGRPGFIFKLEIEYEDGTKETVVSDNTTWHCQVSNAWKPGHYRRWFMGSLQEDFDARLQPQGWTEKSFVENDDWLQPIVLNCAANLPIFANPDRDEFTGIHGPRKFSYGYQSTLKMDMRPRGESMMRETWIGIPTLAEQYRIQWTRPIDEYFNLLTINAYKAEKTTEVKPLGNGSWELELDPKRGTILTFALKQQMVGWPAATIDAPAGTTIEIMTEDAHAIGGPAIMNCHYKWARFTCREGVNRFQQFDFDCFRWMQIHIHPGHGKVVVSNVGILEREYPWPHEPRVVTSDTVIQRVLDASTNTLRNAAQETFVDGMSRERNQYSGGMSFCRFPIMMLGGETKQVARFLKSFSQGQTKEGYFMDNWPSMDRIARLSQRLLDAHHCGTSLDIGVRFTFDNWDYYKYTGDLEPLRDTYPRLLKQQDYLKSIMQPDGLLPVDPDILGFPIVYVGFIKSYPNNRDRQCAFNLFWASSLTQAMAPICRAFGDFKLADEFDRLGKQVLETTQKRFWSKEHEAFVDNLPWYQEDGGVHFSDMTLGLAVEYGLCPEGKIGKSIELIIAKPKNLGIDNSTEPVAWGWWALIKGGRADLVLKDFREWYETMPSIRQNNTIQEFYGGKPDKEENWSHCCVAPLYVATMSLAGIQPIEPGYKQYEIRPQLADLPDLSLTVYTPKGEIKFLAKGNKGARKLTLTLPVDEEGILVVDPKEKLGLKSLGNGRFALPAGKTITLTLKHT